MKSLFFISAILISFSATAAPIQVGDLVFADIDRRPERPFGTEQVVCTVKGIKGENADIACDEFNDETHSCQKNHYVQPLELLSLTGPLPAEMYGVRQGSLILGWSYWGTLFPPPYTAEAFVPGREYDPAEDRYFWFAHVRDSLGCWHETDLDLLPIRDVDFPSEGPQMGGAVWAFENEQKDSLVAAKVIGITEGYYIPSTTNEPGHESPLHPPAPITRPRESFKKRPEEPIYALSNGLSARQDGFYFWESKELEESSGLHPGDIFGDDKDELRQIGKIIWNGCIVNYDGESCDPKEQKIKQDYDPLLLSTTGIPFVGYYDRGESQKLYLVKDFFGLDASKVIPVKSGYGIEGGVVKKNPSPGADKIVALSDGASPYFFPFLSSTKKEKASALSEGIGNNNYSIALTESLHRFLIFVCDGVEQNGDAAPAVKKLCEPEMPDGPKPRDVFALEI